MAGGRETGASPGDFGEITQPYNQAPLQTLGNVMPTSPVKTRIPLTSFGHLITEVKRQLLGIEGPDARELKGWRKHFNSYTLPGRRNCVLVTYGAITMAAVVYMLKKSWKTDSKETSLSA